MSIKYSISSQYKANVTQNGNEYTFFYPCSSSIECTYYKLRLLPGKYKIELWGAQGGDGRYQNTIETRPNSGGKGSYVSGIISLYRTTTFYLYIGGRGEDQINISKAAYGHGGYNGGGNGGADLQDEEYGESGAGGGGSTDIRLIPDVFNPQLSLISRIIVAAGGGGACSSNKSMCLSPNVSNGGYLCGSIDDNIVVTLGFAFADYRGGHGGNLHGYTYNNASFPGKQSSGMFGRGSDGISFENIFKFTGSIAGCGSGYYGGTTISHTSELYYEVGGSGGSSFISGMDGCNAVSFQENGEIQHTNQSVHYSGYFFTEPIMRSGMEYMNDSDGNIVLGHSKNGCAKITLLNSYNTQKMQSFKRKTYLFF